jgi:hypothetical protein
MMPSIVSQTQPDSPRTTALYHSEYNPTDIPVDDVVVGPVVQPPLVALVAAEQNCEDKSSPALWSFLSWKPSVKKVKAKPVQVASHFRNVKGSSSGKVSASHASTSSFKKRGKIVNSPSVCPAVSDPASLLLAKKLHHEYLMELHDRFKKPAVGTVADCFKKPAVGTVAGGGMQLSPLAKPQKTMHGLAPHGMSIPEKGKAFVMRVDNTVKEPVKESNSEMFNRFELEEESGKKKEDKKEVKKLKREGKVRTLAPYMYS